MNTTVRLLEVGPQVLEVEEPDRIVYRLRAKVQASELRAMREEQRVWQRDRPYLLVLIDITQWESTTTEARKEAIRHDGGTLSRAVAVVGGNFAARTVVDLVFRALRMLGFKQATFSLFLDEASAREWLVAQRPELARRS